LIGGYLASRGEPFWCVSGGLAGVIAVAAGIDIYHPALAFVVAVAGGVLMVAVGHLLERFRIDDAVGAVAVHGAVGLWSLLALGIFAAGYPNIVGPDTSLAGQAVGALTFLALGFVPGWVCSKALALAGLLRIPAAAEQAGLDLSEIPASAFPEGIPPTPEPRIAATALAHTNGHGDLEAAEPVAR
ncbi:MAG: hypothetical protein JW895_17605, partial [Thermoleophilaceae bacterium]|nr:hypothetical protein [Thermoleophilaceae bacterium]